MNESSIVNIKDGLEIRPIIKKETRQITKNAYLTIKRFFDIISSIIGLIITFPIFIIVAILIKKEDNGEVFLVQKRIGKHGKEFNLYKFRSMVKNADEILANMLKDPKLKQEYKKNMKFKNDPRITKIGRFIRKTSIDELPQLLNVLIGNMSLIGNRPYLPREKEDMGEYYNDIIKTKPGITGYWQTSGRSKISFQDRCKLESYYSNNMNLKLDTKIFFKTFEVVLFGRGAE